MKPAVSTIIPVLNDTLALRRCLNALRACEQSELNQIIVVDGGASPECRATALEFGAAHVSSEPGRGVQMNRGAALATGAWLWFLHADCTASKACVASFLDRETSDVWGCFQHSIDAPSKWLRVIEAADNWRARALRTPYGDQGIFVRADVFRAVGGFEPVRLLEDVLLARRLAEWRAPLVLKPLLTCDARRWLRDGILHTTLTNWRIVFEFACLKKTPDELAALYHKMEL